MSLVLLLSGGGVVHLGAGTLTGQGTTSAAGIVDRPGTAALTAVAAFTPNGARILLGATGLTGVGKLGPVRGYRPVPAGHVHEYRVLVVDQTGARIAELRDARVGRVSWELNRPGEATITVPTTGYRADEIELVDREIQIFRDGDLLWWGVPWRARATDERIEVGCEGLFSYLHRRRVGAAEPNLLTNPSFETGVAGWQVAVSPAHGSPTLVHTQSSSRALDGSFSMRQQQTEGDLNEYSFLEVTGEPDATYVLEAYVWVDVYELPAVELRGLYLGDETNSVRAFTTIDRSPSQRKPHPLGQWIRHAVQITTGPATPTLRIRLYCPQGVCLWDNLRLVKAGALTFSQTEQIEIAWALIEHALGQGGTDLNITKAPVYRPSGVARDRSYPFHEAAEIGSEVEAFTELDAGLDFDIRTYPDGRREWTPYWPRRGVRRAAAVLERGRNIVAWQLHDDATRMANEVIVYGQGDGAARLRASAREVAGVLVQRVATEPAIEYAWDLQGRAQRLLRALKTPPRILTLTVTDTPTPLMGVLEPGDVVPVRIDRGAVQIAGDYRVMKITLNPREETLELECEPDLDGAPRIGRLDLRDAIGEFVTGRVFEPNQIAFPDFTAGFADTDYDFVVFSKPGTLKVASGQARFEFPFPVTITGVTVTVGTAPAGADMIVDVTK